MAKDYNKTANTALKLIKKSGLPCQVVTNATTTFPAEPWKADVVTKSFDDCFSARVPASQRDVIFLPEGTSISTTAKFLIDAVTLSTDPKIGSQIKHNGTEFQITAIKPLSPADVNVMWTVYATV